MREISQEIAIAFDGEGHRHVWFLQEDLDDLFKRLWQEFRASDIGRKLIARGGPEIMDRVLAIYGERSTARHPGVYPVFEHLEEIGNDLLVELPEVVPVALVPVKPVVNLTPARPVPTPSKECSQFAYLFNDQLMNRGVESCKQKCGIVTLEQNGKKYVYKAAEADALLDEAISFGLIR